MPQTSALLLIDVQESFRHRPYWRLDDVPSFFDRTNALIAAYEAHDLPIVRVLHLEPTGAFALESGWVTPMKEVPHHPALTVYKSAHSAFAGTPLASWLTARGIRKLVVTGIRTEQCCETTTRQASDSGFEVDYVTEATLTFPMTNAKGRLFSPAEIKERTELVLADRFARIRTAAEVVGEL